MVTEREKGQRRARSLRESHSVESADERAQRCEGGGE
jgi:hypothetical protein